MTLETKPMTHRKRATMLFISTLVTGACSESTAPTTETTVPQPADERAVSATATAKPSVGTGSGSLALPGRTLKFTLANCTLKPFKLGMAEYDFRFQGSGTTAAGQAFRISGHRMLGSDGRQSMTQQTVLAAIAPSEPAQPVTGTALKLPAEGELLESTLYHTEAGGWTRMRRKVEGDVALRIEGQHLTGSIPFTGTLSGTLTLRCDEGAS